MIPMLQARKQQYDFVGTYFINVGDDAQPANENFTNWSVSLPYYNAILQMGNEIGTHSDTHLVDPPTTTRVRRPRPRIRPAGSIQVHVSALPSYNGATLGHAPHRRHLPHGRQPRC